MKIELEKGVTITLTSEQIADIDRQRKVSKLPKTVKEAQYIINPVFFIDVLGNIVEAHKDYVRVDSNNVPSEAAAKSVLAYCQLLTVCEAITKASGAVKGDILYRPALDNGENVFFIANGVFTKHSPLKLYTESDCQHLIDNFSDLLYDFFMIEKNNQKSLHNPK